MDLQNGIISRLPSLTTHLPHYATTIAAARAASIPVLYVKLSFRPHHPEISPNNKAFSRVTPSSFLEGSDDTTIPSPIAPEDGDIIVTKLRVSAFAGSDLELLLRSLGVQKVVLAGVSTSGVVLSTLRQAADLDYEVTVLRDLCFDGDEEVHRVLMEKVFPKQAEVVGADEWVAGLKE